jgi:hypothetical protein
MLRKHSAIFTTILIIFTMMLSSAIGAETEQEKKVFNLEGNMTGHLNVKLVKFDVYTHPNGFQKDLFFVPKLGDVIIDAKEGLVFEPVEFTKTKSTNGYTLAYKSLTPVEGSRVELRQLHNKWKLKAQWKENTFLADIPFKPGVKPSPRKKVEPAKQMTVKKQPPVPEKKPTAEPAPAAPAKKNDEPPRPKAPEVKSPSGETPDGETKENKGSLANVPHRDYPVDIAAIVVQYPGSTVLHDFGKGKERLLVLALEGDHRSKAIEFYREEMKKTKWTKKEEGPLGHQYFLSYIKGDKRFGISISSLNQKTRLSLTLKIKK